MIRDLRFTVYDFIGYLLAGVPGLTGLLLGAWAVSGPLEPLRVASPSTAGWFALGLAAYVIGHAVQAGANLVVKLARIDEFGGLGTPDGPVSVEMLKQVRERLRGLLDVTAGSPGEIYAACDEWVAQHGKTADRSRIGTV